ncbi:GGDEF domain-containing protein, partial [Micromonospora sp. SL1-18]
TPVRLPSGAVVSVTASIGLAPASPSGLAATLAAADAAMYRAKSTRAGVAVFNARRDDHATADPRPAVRVRDLASVEVGR